MIGAPGVSRLVDFVAGDMNTGKVAATLDRKLMMDFGEVGSSSQAVTGSFDDRNTVVGR